MFFLFYLGVTIVYILIAFGVSYLIAKWVKVKWGEKRAGYALIGTIAAFFLIPAAIAFGEQVYFKHYLCGQAGVMIYKSVEGVEGFRHYYLGQDVTNKVLKHYGYRFLESKKSKSSGKLSLYTLDGSGNVVREEAELPVSKYALEYNQKEIGEKIQYVISDVKTGDVLATYTNYDRGPNWYKPWLSAGYCDNTSQADYDAFVIKTLIPAVSSK
jgi:hypothetical protein